MIVRNYVTGGLKAPKHIAQGNALCTKQLVYSPCKGKSPNKINAFAPSGRVFKIDFQDETVFYAVSIL